METIACVIEDRDSWWQPAHSDENDIVELLNSKSVQFLGWPEWLKIDATEKALGAVQERERIKLVDREDFLEAAFKNYQA
jgi:ferredoxin--NADP+ reductase